jgi:hypothetical protein
VACVPACLITMAAPMISVASMSKGKPVPGSTTVVVVGFSSLPLSPLCALETETLCHKFFDCSVSPLHSISSLSLLSRGRCRAAPGPDAVACWSHPRA